MSSTRLLAMTTSLSPEAQAGLDRPVGRTRAAVDCRQLCCCSGEGSAGVAYQWCAGNSCVGCEGKCKEGGHSGAAGGNGQGTSAAGTLAAILRSRVKLARRQGAYYATCTSSTVCWKPSKLQVCRAANIDRPAHLHRCRCRRLPLPAKRSADQRPMSLQLFLHIDRNASTHMRRPFHTFLGAFATTWRRLLARAHLPFSRSHRAVRPLQTVAAGRQGRTGLPFCCGHSAHLDP